MDDTEYALTPGEKQNAGLVRLCKELERRLAKRREVNDHVSTDAVMTAVTRGRIAELKDLIALLKE